MDLLEMGIAAARSGNRAEARMLLEGVTLQEPDNAQAFLWLGFVMDEPKLALRCLERVLELDPNNQQAQRGLAWHRSQQAGKGEALPQRLPDAELSILLQALNHTDERAVLGAIRRLREASDSRAAEPLVQLLISAPSKAIKTQAHAALISIGTPSVEPVLGHLMKERDPQVVPQLAAVLARVRSISALEACREVVLGAEHPVARYSMALNLTASAHGDAAMSVLRDYLTDARHDERAQAAVVMAIGQAIKGGTLEASQSVPVLMEIRVDSSLPPSMQRAALVALGISSQPSVVKTIFEATGGKDEQMRVAAVDALARFTPPQVDLLDKLARSTDQAVRTRANQILDKLQADQT
ncbi:MAG: HEAT repeat domain-containing protein [Anaerolineae bacterium]